jgi:hypothetical protein
MPHVLGLKLISPDRPCEADIVLAVDDLGVPIVIVGEVKSQNPLDVDDFANLANVQEYLRSRNIECFVLAATLQDRFQQEELTMLRGFCENPPDAIYRRYRGSDPVLPMVLSNRDVSAPEHSDEHPMSWMRQSPGREFGMIGLAIESCRRNLGLADISYEPTTDGPRWHLTWS